MPVSTTRRFVTVLLLVSFSLIFGSPQQQTQTTGPEEKPRNVKREIKEAYVEWINDPT